TVRCQFAVGMPVQAAATAHLYREQGTRSGIAQAMRRAGSAARICRIRTLHAAGGHARGLDSPCERAEAASDGGRIGRNGAKHAGYGSKHANQGGSEQPCLLQFKTWPKQVG